MTAVIVGAVGAILAGVVPRILVSQRLRLLRIIGAESKTLGEVDESVKNDVRSALQASCSGRTNPGS
jgi:hypothetical protein